tara:strand:+ start:8585 stop:9067 length:483 start_codon:yes stop_codon:yes gene_type:complete
MNKTLILNRIQEELMFNVDADFARFLEISPSRLANWKARGTFNTQILYTKCESISSSFILKGEEPVSADEQLFIAQLNGYEELTEEQSKASAKNHELWEEFIDECFRRKQLREPFPYGDGVPSSEDNKLLEVKEKLIASHEERIKELKEYIDLLKEKVKA